MVPTRLQRLLIGQTTPADPLQPGLASVDPMASVTSLASIPGLAFVSTEELLGRLLASTHVVRWGAGALQGEVTIEAADDVRYDGLWSIVAVLTLANGQTTIVLPGGTTTIALGLAPKVDLVQVSGYFPAFRHRITQQVVGGAGVDTKIFGVTG